MAINFPSNPAVDDTYELNGTTWVWDGTTWTVVTSSGGSGGSGNITKSFESIAVDTQSTLIADGPTDTLNIIAGAGIELTTDPNTDSLTITNTIADFPVGFGTIAVTTQSDIDASVPADTLTVAAGSGITLQTNNTTKTITISSELANFSGLTDANTAGLTVDKFYLPAITMLDVTNSGTTAYLFDQYSGNNPTIYAINGTTIAFNLNVLGHPFQIQSGIGVNYNTGLIHVTPNGLVSTGANAQSKTSGVLYWKIPAGISGTYRYQSSTDAPMVGAIVIKNFISL